MQRFYQAIIGSHFERHQQMLFFAGPRQVGKTTLSLAAQTLSDRFLYLNWDNAKHRTLMLQGEDAILAALQYSLASAKRPILVFDEIHKYKGWQTFLKGFYDVYKSNICIIVTGSAKLNVYRKGGDSLLGRYLLYRIHPFSVGELLKNRPQAELHYPPQKLSPASYNQLFELGGFPEPFTKTDARFAQQWQRLRRQQLIREDIQALSQIQDVAHLEVLAHLLREQAGQLASFTNLAKAIRVANDTIRRWLTLLETVYYCFSLKPWHSNVKRSLLKGPKFYLFDWSEIQDTGARFENFIACHLLKAVQFWNDDGAGEFSLHFIRDKEKREVDFLVARDHTPWLLIEAKCSASQRVSPALQYFQKQLNVPHAMQVVHNLPFQNIDCFAQDRPVIVPAQTFLSQLI